MAIYAYGEPEGSQKFVYDSLVKDGVSRYLYSRFDNCDLNRLRDSAERRTKNERIAWEYGKSLLYFRPGDWVLHKNVPRYGQVTAARLSSEYFYQAETPAQHQDGRQCFRVDKVFTFTNDYTEQGLHKVLYNEIAGKRGALYPVTCDREFYETIIALKGTTKLKLDDVDSRNIKAFGGISKKVFDSKWKNHFKREVYELLERNNLLSDVAKIIKRYANPDERNRAICDLFDRNGLLGDLTTIIQRSHPRKILEGFVAKVLRKIYPNDTVFENGSGWKSDHGADLIVGNVIDGTSVIYRPLVIQVKSYVGEVDNPCCIDNIVAQLEMAIKYYGATGAILITTGYSTPALEAAIEKLEHDMNTDISIIAGDEFARLVLRSTGLDLLF